jgi:type III pantothenate kinase
MVTSPDPSSLPNESPLQMSEASAWIGLVVGNTRLHWAVFKGDRPLAQWHTCHLTAAEAVHLIQSEFAPAGWGPSLRVTGTLPPQTLGPLPLYIASVVPTQTDLWRTYGPHRVILSQTVPLDNLYPTLGVDRALNLWAAGDRYGWPVLVIDSGTALTFTAGDRRALVGGAILPGIDLQFQTLGQHTAHLPRVHRENELGDRWSRDTPNAIRSGILHGILATANEFIGAWRQAYPQGQVVMTGGDGLWLYHQLQRRYSPSSPQEGSRPWARSQGPNTETGVPWLHACPDLTFWGIHAYRNHQSAGS